LGDIVEPIREDIDQDYYRNRIVRELGVVGLRIVALVLN
jgi:hypothetical protein